MLRDFLWNRIKIITLIVNCAKKSRNIEMLWKILGYAMWASLCSF